MTNESISVDRSQQAPPIRALTRNRRAPGAPTIGWFRTATTPPAKHRRDIESSGPHERGPAAGLPRSARDDRSSSASPKAWAHQPALDGLRAVAVYLVVVFHSNVSWVSGGFVGVDIFFVLSGYLVTNVLLSEWSRTERIDLRRFYARRVRRLLPAAAITIVVTAFVATLVLSRISRQALVGDAQASLLYVANWNFLGDTTDYFADGSEQSPFLHFWSLAIEEQFYFVFPAVLILILRATRGRQTVLVGGIAALFASSFVAQLLVADSNPLRAYYGTDTRIYQMLAGALLAALPVTIGSRRASSLFHRWSQLAAPAAFIGLLFAATSLVSVSASQRGILGTALAVLLIHGVMSAPNGRTAVALSAKPLTYLGRISYGTYLWHWPIIVLLRPVYQPNPYMLVAIAIVTATALAAVSARLIESPIRFSSTLDRTPRRVIGAGLALSAIIAVLVAPTTLTNDRRPVEAARTDRSITTYGPVTSETSRAVPDELDLEATRPIEIDRSDCTPSTPEGCIIIEGSGAHLHLIGDSNADVMIHALLELADEQDWTLSVNTELGCPWQQELTWVTDSQQRIDNCVTARTDWYDTYIPALQPDIVVAVGVPRDRQARSDGSVYIAHDSDATVDIDDAVADATDKSVDAITSATDAVILLVEPLPYALDFDPTKCLTTADIVGDCAYETSTSALPVESTYRRLAARHARVFTADIDRLACPYLPVCTPMIDDEIVFRNQLHLSDNWFVFRRHDLFDILQGTGVLDAT